MNGSCRGRSFAGYDRGSATLELVVLAPALLLLVGLVVFAGRITVTAGSVEQAASAAAREASLARSVSTARSAAAQAARAALAERGMKCSALAVTTNTAGFAVRVGRPATVTTTVSCTVSMADLAMPGLPGSRTLTSSAVSPLDTYRSR